MTFERTFLVRSLSAVVYFLYVVQDAIAVLCGECNLD